MSGHFPLGPSSAYRWIACPGSARLSMVQAVTPSSAAAERGTALHAAAAQLLASGKSDLLMSLDPEDQTQVRHAVGIVANIKAQYRGKTAIEEKISLKSVLDRDDCGGTPDVMHWTATKGWVVDFKFGFGRVEALDNDQLQLYALHYLPNPRIKEVTLMIIQHPDIRIVKMTRPQLEALVPKYKEAAARTDIVPPIYVAGEKQCRWCPAAGVCDEHHKFIQAVVLSDFRPVAEEINVERVAAFLKQGPMIKQALAQAEEWAVARINAGLDVPGFKMVEGRKTREWKPMAADVLELAGYEIWKPKEMLSPAQFEKTHKEGKKAIQNLITVTPGKPKLTSTLDPRDPLAPDFERIES